MNEWNLGPHTHTSVSWEGWSAVTHFWTMHFHRQMKETNDKKVYISEKSHAGSTTKSRNQTGVFGEITVYVGGGGEGNPGTNILYQEIYSTMNPSLLREVNSSPNRDR